MATKGQPYKHPPGCGHCQGGWKWSRESREKLSTTNQGHELSTETRAKIADTLRGRFVGPDNPTWAGDDVGYAGIHIRAQKALPRECALADETCLGILEVCVRHDAKELWEDEQGRIFSTRIEDYWRLCRSHHRRLDRSEERRRGPGGRFYSESD